MDIPVSTQQFISLPIGTDPGTIAAGDDERIVNAAKIARLPVNVKDRGVKGDGSNETTMIQAADTYAAAQGRLLYFPAGTYIGDKFERAADWVGDGKYKSKIKSAARTYADKDYFIRNWQVNGLTTSGLQFDVSDAIFPPGTLDATIVSASGTGSVCTLILDQPVTYPIGQYITVWKTTSPSVTDIGASSYFGLFTVTASSPGCVSYAHTAIGAISAPGKIQANPGNIFSVFAGYLAVRCEINDCSFIGLKDHVLAIATSGCSDWDVSSCYFENLVPSVQQSQAFNVSTAHGPSERMVFRNNICNGTGVFSNGAYTEISNNHFRNVGFGSAVAIGPIATSLCNKIRGNTMTGGHGMDVNYTYVSGVEIWTPYTEASGNIIIGNSGHGVSFGNTANKIEGNIIINNGILNGAGICAYGKASTVAANSRVHGNISIDTNSPANRKQAYGYAEYQISGTIQGIALEDNILEPNSLGSMLQASEVFSFRGPNLAKRYAAIPVGTVTNGSTFVSVQTFAGARLGDKVSVSLGADHKGCFVYGEVDNTNQISLFVKNLTGADQAIGTVTINVSVDKPIGYSY